MVAKYTPPPGLAVCPHCGAETGPLPISTTGLEWAALSFRCPTCARSWRELRDADATTRYWEPTHAS